MVMSKEEDITIEGEGHTLWNLIGSRIAAQESVEYVGKKILEGPEGRTDLRVRILANEDPGQCLARAADGAEAALHCQKIR